MQLVWHQNPDEAVRQQCIKLEQIRKKSGARTYWATVREVIKRDPWFTMRVALEWAWLDETLVGSHFIRHIAENWGEDLAVLFPRGHGKTLPMSAIIITAIINDPNISILEISRTEDNANKFGEMVSQQLMYNDYLQQCFGTKYNPEKGFLPATVSECSMWGRDGYSLPNRKPRLDPTLLCIPLKGAKAGKHPDFIYIDDPTEEENNNQQGWEHVERMVDGCKMLLPPDGFFLWTGTRWHDADPLGRIEAGKLRGKQGAFKVVKFSCYVDDNPHKPPIYDRKVRWNMTKPTGYTHEALEEMRKSKTEGGLGEFFDAQMRNDPAPAERADIKVKEINIYDPDKDLPSVGPIRAFGIETTGGGLPIYNGLVEYAEKLKIPLALVQIVNPRKLGITKRDRIVAAIQPIVASGKMWAQEWMIGDDRSTDTLGYELRRIGKAAHDDIADALHNVPTHLAKGVFPSRPDVPADLYISCDLAYSEDKRADWTVVIAVAVDHSGNHWILDYDRFQISSPTGIYERLIAFYRKFEEVKTIRRMSNKRYPGAWR